MVSGIVNDLVVMGVELIVFVNLMIIGEGFDMEVLKRVFKFMDEMVREVFVLIVMGDIKVVEDKIEMFVIIVGIGIVEYLVSDVGVKVGDVVFVSGIIGDYGIVLMSYREGIVFEIEFKSDVVLIWDVVKVVVEIIGWENIYVMKDLMRVGLSNVFNEIVCKSNVGIFVREVDILIRLEVRVVSEMLGISFYDVVNEGKVVMVVVREYVEEVFEVMRKMEKGRNVVIIGEVIVDYCGKVFFEMGIGGKRFMEFFEGDFVLRIC